MNENWMSDPRFAESAVARSFQNTPLGYVDVGARDGFHSVIEPIASLAAALGFEPDPTAFQSLQTQLNESAPWPVWHIEPIALAGEKGERDLHCLMAQTNNSLLQAEPIYVSRYGMDKWHSAGTEKIQADTLDAVLQANPAKFDRWGEFIKLDTQGTEYDILSAAQNTLKTRTLCVFTEAAFFPVYQKQKLFSDIERLLRSHGFAFYGFTDLHCRSQKKLDKRVAIGKERCFWADAVFFKDPFDPGGRLDVFSDRDWSVLFVTAALLGFYDFALEVCHHALTGNSQNQGLEKFIHSLANHDPQQSVQEVNELFNRVNNNPQSANLHVGAFVDRKRANCAYHDIPLDQDGG